MERLCMARLRRRLIVCLIASAHDPPPTPTGTLFLDIPPCPPKCPPHSSRWWMGHLHALCLWSCTVVVYDRSTCRWRHECCLTLSTYQPSYAFLVSVALTFSWRLVLPFASLFSVCSGVASKGGCDWLPDDNADSQRKKEIHGVLLWAWFHG